MGFFSFRRRANDDLDDEFQFHLEKHIEDGIARGLTPDEARTAAMRALDRVELRKEECRDERRFAFLDSLLQDVRYALRVLRKSPAFTTVAILSLALGIGANTAIFSVMDVLLLRPLPVNDPDRLQLVTPAHGRYSFNYPLFEMVRDRNEIFSETFAWSMQQLQTPIGPDMILTPAVLASGDYFKGLGVAPELGRVFGREDDQITGGKNGPVAVISDGYWSARYHRDPAIVGKTVVLNAVPVTIIGVMPAGFFGAEVGTAPDVWVPLNLQRQLQDARCINSPSCWFLRVMGRPKAGVSVEGAAAQLRAISPRIMADNHPPERADRRAEYLSRVISIEPGSAGFSSLRGQMRKPLIVLMSLVGLVLLIACANMANLLSARASARFKEVAVRLAMGAGRARVIRQFLTESLLLAFWGALGGFAIAIWATRALIATLSSIGDPIVLDLRPDWRVLLFTALAAVGSGMIFGLVSAIRSTRVGIGVALKERAHQIQGSGNRFGATRVLLGFQVALSIVLVAAAGLLAGSLVRLLNRNPGFDPHNVTVIQLVTAKLPFKGPAMMALYDRIRNGARSLPGVESSALMSTTPLTDSGWDNYIDTPAGSGVPEEQRDAYINAVSPGFLTTMRIPLIAGRDFSATDTEKSMKVTILSETAARRLYPSGDAIGHDIVTAGGQKKELLRVIGIVRDSKYMNMREDASVTVFFSNVQWTQTGYIALRTNNSLRQTYALFQDLLRQLAPGAPIRSIRTMEQQIDESLNTERLVAYLSVFFAVLALLLTAVGLYGVLAYSVSRRTTEIGVRMALGAQRPSVMWMIVREAMGHTVAGAVAGIGAVVLSAKLIRSLLYGVQPNDPATMILSVAALGLVCAIGAWMPARRASRLDPMVALREE